jgi:hypothetical protein
MGSPGVLPNPVLTKNLLKTTLQPRLKRLRKSPGFFHSPRNLGALPDLWLQQKLTISFKQFFDKWARVLVVVAVAVWLRGDVGEVESTVRAVARSLPSD